MLPNPMNARMHWPIRLIVRPMQYYNVFTLAHYKIFILKQKKWLVQPKRSLCNTTWKYWFICFNCVLIKLQLNATFTPRQRCSVSELYSSLVCVYRGSTVTVAGWEVWLRFFPFVFMFSDFSLSKRSPMIVKLWKLNKNEWLCFFLLLLNYEK